MILLLGYLGFFKKNRK